MERKRPRCETVAVMSVAGVGAGESETKPTISKDGFLRKMRTGSGGDGCR